MFKSVVIGLSLISSLVAPFKDSYTISIPTMITINEQGEIPITLKQNNLSDNQLLTLTFPNEFYLSDRHGHSDITGTIENNQISFSNSSNTINVSYSLKELPPGEWTGQIPMTIDLSTSVSSNQLITGSELNSILSSIKPKIITFSHDDYSYEESYDLSAAKDNSITLYNTNSNGEVIISNHCDEKILVTDLSSAFKNITSIITINHFDYFDTSKCEDMSYLFYGCSRLTTVNGFDNIDTSKIKNMSYLFYRTRITDFSFLENWNTNHLENIDYLFSNTRGNSVDLSNWNTSNITSMEGLFQSSRFSSINLTGWDTNACINAKYLFNNCSYLTSIIGFEGLSFSNLIDGSYFFANSKISSIDLSGLQFNSATNLSYFFYGCSQLSSITGLENLDVSNVNDLSHFFEKCTALKDLNLSGWDTHNVTNISYFMAADVQDSTTYNNFASCTGFENLNLSNVKDASYIFYQCKYLTINDLSNLQFIHIENIDYMFYGTSNINTSNLDNWSNVWIKTPSMNNAFSDNLIKPSWYN